MPFCFSHTDLPGLTVIEPKAFCDHRGFFMETYKQSEFAAAGINETFVQCNRSQSTKGTLRGLHFQRSPGAQGKLVQALSGEIYDVAVDLRRGSRTYRKWLGVLLSAVNKKMLYVPVGFAHGFCVVSDVAEVEYKVNTFYSPPDERGLQWNDPNIGIDWPVAEPIVSERDRGQPSLREARAEFFFE